jgi:hypothetical protein
LACVLPMNPAPKTATWTIALSPISLSAVRVMGHRENDGR